MKLWLKSKFKMRVLWLVDFKLLLEIIWKFILMSDGVTAVCPS